MTELTQGFAIGRHLIADLNGCAYDTIATAERVREIMLKAARKSGATIICDEFRHFSPHGVSGFVVISESHFSIHTWPEYSFAAIDIFTCGDSVNFNTAIEVLREGFGAQNIEITADLFRGTGVNASHQMVAEKISVRELSWQDLFQRTKAWGMRIDIELIDCDLQEPAVIEETVLRIVKRMNMPALCKTFENACAKDAHSLTTYSACFHDVHVSAYQKMSSDTAYIEFLTNGFVDPQILGIAALEESNAKGYRLRISLRR